VFDWDKEDDDLLEIAVLEEYAEQRQQGRAVGIEVPNWLVVLFILAFVFGACWVSFMGFR
jgi:hypothetical protein